MGWGGVGGGAGFEVCMYLDRAGGVWMDDGNGSGF